MIGLKLEDLELLGLESAWNFTPTNWLCNASHGCSSTCTFLSNQDLAFLLSSNVQDLEIPDLSVFSRDLFVPAFNWLSLQLSTLGVQTSLHKG
jgi:hypothetical protein